MDRSRGPRALAKMMTYVLARHPGEFGLVPDADGFVRVKDLLKALHEEDGWRHVNSTHLNEVLLSVPEAGFELTEGRIRAGTRRDPEPEDQPPPKLLYACIRRRAYPHVHAEGLEAPSPPGVILAVDREMAERLGRRIDPDPVLLTVNVQLLRDAGRVLTPAGSGLFATDRVPAGTFTGPPLPKEKPEESRAAGSTAEPQLMPGSFAMDVGRTEAGAHVPESLKRRTADGKKIDRKRLKKDKWSRERPPWRR
jgi:putative RNA 2'-phosphotransferase